MPLSTMCVSTVSGRRRLWSSQTNIHAKDKDVSAIVSMNSTEEISSYRSPQEFYASPPLTKRSLGCGYDFPEKSKKEKKWSFGSFFRRKRKEESESSSEEEQKKSIFLGRRRRKSDGKRKKPVKTVGTFDHVVLPRTGHVFNGYGPNEDQGILSDPSCGFSNYCGRGLPSPQLHSLDTSRNGLNDSMRSVGSADSLGKKNRRDMAKARAAARRTVLGDDSSSDEDSQRSNSSLRIRSDESLMRPQESNHSRRSRAARTERYLKRHSKDGESPSNYLKLYKSDADDSNRSPSRSPNVKSLSSSQTSNLSGLSTIPPSHGVHGKYRVSNSTSNPSYKPPLSMNEYNSAVGKNPIASRSASCDANIHKAPSFEDNVIRVQFPIVRPNTIRGHRNLSLIDGGVRHPPQPPPRDPNRMVAPHYFENGRPSTCYFDHPKPKSFHGLLPNYQIKPNVLSLHPSYRSSSEMNLPNDPFQIQSPVRPASTTPEPKHNLRRNERHTVDTFNYLADKNPRSRRPIFIQTNTKSCECRKDSPTQKALDFWKQIDDSVNKSCGAPKPTPQMFTSQTHVQTQVFVPSVVNGKTDQLPPPRNVSPFRPVKETEEVKRKSSNLEEALDELEAIYNSLRLGDEDLLERAEQREKESAAKKLQDAYRDSYVGYVGNRGALSDSSFSYEPFDQVDSPKRKRILKKNRMPDTKQDDMYNRRVNRDKSATISDPQSVLSSVSYLLASPVHGASVEEPAADEKTKNKEPSVTFDDVVYRNVKRSLSSPKTVEPQPPFGIPLGPVTPAPNSDYLHAAPITIYQPTYKSRKIPDVVKDDMAFRNLRKDSNKEPALPPCSGEDAANFYPNDKLDLNYLKKRRAVRSLSANIGNLLHRDVQSKDIDNEFNTLTDIADAMEIAKRVLQEKGKNIAATKKGFLSDTEVKPSHVNGELLKERKKEFLDGLTSSGDGLLSSRPPSGLATERKSSTPMPKSPLQDSSLDDLLNALTKGAKATTDTNQADDKSDHDYENLDSDKEPNEKCQSPFEEKKAELIATFQDLKQDIEDIKVPSFETKKTDSVYDNLEDVPNKNDDDEGEPEFDAYLDNLVSACKSPINTNNDVFTSNCEIVFKPSTESAKLDPLESLKSPKLVMESARLYTSDVDLDSRQSTSKGVDKSDSRFRECMPSKEDQDTGCKPWYHDPTKVAVACSYGLACAHQLASIDLVAVLSILFAVISFIAALFI